MGARHSMFEVPVAAGIRGKSTSKLIEVTAFCAQYPVTIASV